MTASIATGPFASGRRSVAGTRVDGYARAPGGRLDGWLGLIGPGLDRPRLRAGSHRASTCCSNPHRYGFYDHFVWQAQAWLEGSASIRYPVSDGIRTNDYYQDVLDLGDAALTARFGLPFQPGHALLPFPPLPAVLLLPFVAVWGLATSGALVVAVAGRHQRRVVLADAHACHGPSRCRVPGHHQLRLRHGRMVCVDAGHDLVPGTRAGQHPAVPVHHCRTGRGAAGGHRGCRPGHRRPHPGRGASGPASCSGWPACRG